jgi:hypothetical protein
MYPAVIKQGLLEIPTFGSMIFAAINLHYSGFFHVSPEFTYDFTFKT